MPEVSGLIKRERPEVICLQEVFEEDFKVFVKKFGMKGVFAPTVFIDKPGKPGLGKRGIFGVAMMSKLPGKFGSEYYFKRQSQELPRYSGKPNAGHRTLVWQEIEGRRKKEEGRRLIVATTHFTWSKGGKVTGKQRRELNKLIELLVNKVKPDVLCGDFNAPRGGEIWSKLAERMIDNIPQEAKTTLDPKLHYANTNGVELVVDGFFTAPKSKVQIKSLRLVGGVSDHLAIAAELIENKADFRAGA